MDTSVVILWLLFTVILVSARGPHHPRGAKVVKRHVHYTPQRETKEKITEDEQLLHDKEHIQEHLEEVISEPDLSKMTDEELEFYYFQVHDTDKNSKLDGLEILQAILHIQDHHDHEDDDGSNEEDNDDDVETKDLFDSKAFEYYVELIDQVLKEDDLDADGYLSYPEYMTSRKQSKIKEMQMSPNVKQVS